MKIGDFTEVVRSEVDYCKVEIAKNLIRCKLEEIKRAESILEGLKSELASLEAMDVNDIEIYLS